MLTATNTYKQEVNST